MKVSRDLLFDLREQRFGWSKQSRIRTFADATAFIESRGICLLWPSNGIELPSLIEARRGQPGWGEEWDDDSKATWEWKDQFPEKRIAFYGKLLHGKGTFVSLDCLEAFLALAGDRTRPDGFRKDRGLSKEAQAVAETLFARGAMPSKALRSAAATRLGASPDKAKAGMQELDNKLWIIRRGNVKEQGTAWESATFDLLPRIFATHAKAALKLTPQVARQRILGRFFDTCAVSAPKIAAKTFGWSRAEAEKTCAALAAQGAVIATEAALTFPPGSFRTTNLKD